jgi:hypothetical protein
LDQASGDRLHSTLWPIAHLKDLDPIEKVGKDWAEAAFALKSVHKPKQSPKEYYRKR